MDSVLPKPIEVTVFYKKGIEKITGKTLEVVMISENSPFIFFLSSIFKSYPEIEKRYPPGMIALTVNGKPPQEFDLLQNGDKIILAGFSSYLN